MKRKRNKRRLGSMTLDAALMAALADCRDSERTKSAKEACGRGAYRLSSRLR